MNIAYKKTSTRKSKKFENLQLSEQEKLALYLFSQRTPNVKKPFRVRDLYFMDQTPMQVRAIEKLGARI